jgi:hypothetical protein
MNNQEFQLELYPYCGESINVIIDCTIPEKSYIEDYQVYYSPINKGQYNKFVLRCTQLLKPVLEN